MTLRFVPSWFVCALWTAVFVSCAGCTPLGEYIRNGLQVGPDYYRPVAPVAEDWIDADDAHVEGDDANLRDWWSVFDDPTLDALVRDAAQQNLTVRQAGFRVLQARAARAIVAGTLFPQTQDAFGAYSRNALSVATANSALLPSRFFDQWDTGFNLAWELDFWGRFRRAVEAADADLNAAVENYDAVLVTLVSDVASTYIEIRTLQRRIELARQNVALQRETLTIADARFRGGQVSEFDVDQATSTLAQTEALIPLLELQLRQATNRLCVLLGEPPAELSAVLGRGPIPVAPPEVTVGIPADLLRGNPAVQRAEREVAAQSARVGIATSELYPHIGITGTIGYSAEDFDELFSSRALMGNVGPSFQWNILNYGRLLNNIRLQDARLAELIVAYQNSVLRANAEVEDGLARFLRSQERTRSLATSVDAADKAAKIGVAQYRGGVIDFTRLVLVEQNLVDQQDQLAQSQGEIAQGLVDTYRALGGGWQIRLQRLPSVEEIPQSAPAAIQQPETIRGEPIPLPLRLPEPMQGLVLPETVPSTP